MVVFKSLILLSIILLTKSEKPTSIYTNKLVLVEPDIFTLYWNYTKIDIIIETHVKNDGWASFELSDNGDITDSNVIIT